LVYRSASCHNSNVRPVDRCLYTGYRRMSLLVLPPQIKISPPTQMRRRAFVTAWLRKKCHCVNR
jgi:hypothetical protein